MTKDKLPFAITFDCDPAVFDSSLELVHNTNFEHLWNSIPVALELIAEAEKISRRAISATFFIRNLTAYSTGMIKREDWLTFAPLWKLVKEEGHYLGLHPHINFPLTSRFDSDCLKIKSTMESDFQSLDQLGARVRVSRVGGHSYNSVTSEILSCLNVRVDSSAIPGRALGKMPGISDWQQYTNGVLRNWSYRVDSGDKRNVSSDLIQVPMCTLEQTSHPGFYRYIDFSFRSFEDHPFINARTQNNWGFGTSVTHPSSLLENTYLKHRTLEFGRDNWLRNFEGFIEEFEQSNVELQFLNLSEA